MFRYFVPKPGDYITEALILDTLYNDMLLGSISLAFVFVYTVHHLGSVVLASCAMFQIALTFPGSLYLYYLATGSATVGMLNVLSVYVMLGIGVDDVFIFFDTFRQTDNMDHIMESVARDADGAAAAATGRRRESKAIMQARLEVAFGTAGKSMFATTFTTACAFLANMFTEIPVIRSFGIFMCILVFWNFVLVITLFPCCVQFWHLEVRRKHWCGSDVRVQDNPPAAAPPQPTGAIVGPEGSSSVVEKTGANSTCETTLVEGPGGNLYVASAKARLRAQAPPPQHVPRVPVLRPNSLSATERFFKKQFSPLIWNLRHVICAAFFAVFAVTVFFAYKVEQSKDTPVLFAEDNPIQRY
jgi:hypothetical protein